MSSLIKNKKMMIVFLVLVAFLVCSVTAYATNIYYNFVFTNDTYTRTSDTGSKNDGEDNWYFTLSSYNSYYGQYNTMSSTNIMGMRMRTTGGTALSAYKTITYATSNKVYPYIVSMDEGDIVVMKYKKDTSSTSSSDLYVSGYVIP